MKGGRGVTQKKSRKGKDAYKKGPSHSRTTQIRCEIGGEGGLRGGPKKGVDKG